MLLPSLTSLLLPLLGLARLSYGKSSTGDSVLVVLEPTLDRASFSTFFTGLEQQGYALTFRAPKDVEPLLIEDDIPSFSHVILFAPETKTFAKDITPQSLVQLLSLDTNLLIALSSKQTPLTSLASEFSLILPPPGTPLISHFPKRKEPATILPIPVLGNNQILSSKADIWFSGVSHALGMNPFLVPILNAPVESFASDATSDSGADALVDAADKGGEGLWAGSSMSVATGFQTKNGARVAWVGGVSMFSDEFANKKTLAGETSGNAQFARDVSAWAFQESLVLRIDNTTHHLVNGTEPQELYTTNDQVVFSTHISAFDAKSGKWNPTSSLKDLQLDFTMLDPHIRTALVPLAGSPGTYTATFRAPDRHGVFKFIIDYKRKGYTHLHSSTTVPVVPPRHDGYARFLSAAWPYYAGAISTSIGFLLFAAIWLAGESKEVKKKGLKAE